MALLRSTWGGSRELYLDIISEAREANFNILEDIIMDHMSIFVNLRLLHLLTFPCSSEVPNHTPGTWPETSNESTVLLNV